MSSSYAANDAIESYDSQLDEQQDQMEIAVDPSRRSTAALASKSPILKPKSLKGELSRKLDSTLEIKKNVSLSIINVLGESKSENNGEERLVLPSDSPEQIAVQIGSLTKPDLPSSPQSSFVSKSSAGSKGSYNITDSAYWIQKYLLLQDWLREKISFRMKLYIYYMLILPTLGIALILVFLPRFEFSSKEQSLVFKTALMLLGYIAVSATNLFMDKIAFVNLVLKINGSNGTTEDLYETAHGKKRSKALKFISVLFYMALLLTELAISDLPIETYFGIGATSVTTLNLEEADPDLPLNIFLASMGMASTCSKCAGISDGTKLIIPLTENLVSIDESLLSNLTQNNLLRINTQHNSQVIYHGVQDVIRLSVECFSPISVSVAVNEHDLIIIPKTVVMGTNSGYLDLEIVGRVNFDGLVKVRRCSIIGEDYSATADIRYAVSDEGNLSRLRVTKLYPADKDSCVLKDNYCLNESSRPGLAYKLLNSVFGDAPFVTDQDYTLTNGMFPDASLNIKDSEYALALQQAIGSVLLVSVGHFVGGLSTSEIWTDTTAVGVSVTPELLYFAIGTCLSIVVVAAFQIFILQLNLRRQPDQFLKHLRNCVELNRHGLVCIADFVSEQSRKNPSAWQEQILCFGEDRRSIGSEKGILRFGQRKEISKFKSGKEYSYTRIMK